jgi:hypothetical protein
VHVDRLSHLEQIIIKNNYPLPRIDNLFDFINGAYYFSCINLKSGYYHICVEDIDVEKTTMKIRYSSYELLVITVWAR